QREIDPARVQDYLTQHPAVGVWLDRLGMFTVYRSPWFAAIYLLLFISLIGCVAPRTLEHARALRTPPPVAPARLSRLSSHAAISVPSQSRVTAVADAADVLRRRHWRVRVAPDSSWLSAERGYLRETGNLLFHSALLLLVIGVGLGKGTGAEGRVVIPVGGSFSNSLAQYDDFRSGPFFDRASLQPFSVKLDKFDVSFERNGTQRGAPRKFDAYLSVREKFGGPTRKELVQVNYPMSIGGMKVYLTSHGYAPKFTVRDKSGAIVWQDSAIFAPEGDNLLSRGAVKVPDSRPQLGFQGVFAPTGLVDPRRGLQSVFPDLDNPRVFMGAFSGDLGLDEGTPQNFFSLDTSRMTRLGIAPLRVGDSWELSNGARITFDGVVRWASFVVASDRTEGIVLAAALLAILGLLLSLFVPRRRLFLRPLESSEPTSGQSGDDATGLWQFELAGLVRSGADTLANDTRELAVALCGTVVETINRDADARESERQEQT
ncbi:MAG: cytochrome c biogenesis protein ResB, partial [Chloroflexi bacterium]|nr:cytochrome c biogenesis protein ResB [Chloroflexota bacterium]